MKIKSLLSKFSLLVMVGFIMSNGYSQSCPAGMISYWKLQEAGGAVFADVKENHDALGATSSPSQTQGISGKAQLFIPNSYISVPSHADFNWAGNGSYTIELWAKFSDGTATEVLIGRDDATNNTHWWIGRTNTGKITWYNRSSGNTIISIASISALNDGLWHHIVAVRNGSAALNYLYVDNVLQNTGGTGYSPSGDFSSTADISIGGLIENNVPKYFYNGAIDEVAIYNVALSTGLISTHFNNAKFYQIGYCDGNNPVLLSTPNIHATVGQAYTYDADASGNPAPTYTLLEKPNGMAIDAATGLISWTPSSVSQNGHVVIQITNTLGSIQQSFNVFIADVPSCRSDLSAYWSFDESGSNPFYDKINNFKLTGNNSSHVTGLIGNALTFNGVSDSLNMKDEIEDPDNVFFDFKGNFSIELWMKSSATPSTAMVLVGRDMKHVAGTNKTQYWLGVNTNGSVGFRLEDYSDLNKNYINGGSVLDGNWHQIVATYDATANAMKLYVDKTLVDEATQNFLDFGGYTTLNIGHLNTSLDKFWYNGMLDELAFYNTALDLTKITSNYDAAMAGNGACTYNYAPVVVTSPLLSVNQETAYSYTIKATDDKEDDITAISAVNVPAWLTLTYNAPDTFAVLSGTPHNGDVGTHNVSLKVADGSIEVLQNFSIQVVNINDAPAFSSTPVATVNEDVAYSYTATATDIDATDVLTYSAQNLPEWLTFDAETHVLSGTPTNDNVGVFNDIVVSVNDGTVTIDQSFDLTVNNVNDLPVITTVAILTVRANEVYMYEIIATDEDEGDVLTYSIDNSSKPAWLTFTPGATNGILTGTPLVANVGSHAVILKVSDGHGEVMQGFTITVSPASAIDEIDNSIVSGVYPNPASDKVYFEFAEPQKTRIEIFDISGNLQKQIVANDKEKVEINISGLSNGLYIYKVYQNNKIGIGKITKE